MADKTTKIIEIEVELEGGEKVTKQFEKLSDGTLKAVDSAQKLDAKFEDIYENIEPLTTRMGEAEDRLYELALAGDTTSKEYQELLTKVGDYRKVQIQTDLAVDQAATTMSEKLGGALTGAASGFAAVQGVMAITGSESEALEESLLKVQGAMAFQQGIDGVLKYSKSIGLASKAQKAFNLIVSLNPLAIFLTVVTSIVASVLAFTDVLDSAIQLLKDLGDAIGITNFEENKLQEERNERSRQHMENMKAEQTLRDAEIKKLEALGKSTIKLRRQQLEADKASLEATAERLRQQKQGFKDIENLFSGKKEIAKLDANEIEIKSQIIALETQLIELNKEQVEKAKEYAENRISATRQIQDAQVELFEEGSKKEIVENKLKFDRLREDTLKATNLTRKEKQKLIELYNKQEIAANKKITDNYIAELERQQTETKNRIDAFNNSFQDEIEALAEENYQRFLTEQEREELAVQDKYFRLETLAEGNAEALAEIEIAKMNELNDIQLKYQQEEIEIEKATQEQKIAAVKNTLSTIANLAELFAGESEREQKKAFKIQKAANIAQATIDTYASAVSSYNSLSGIPVVGPVLGGAAAAAAVTAGLLNIKSIAQQEFGGGVGDTPAVPSDVGGGGAPQFNVVGDSGVNQLAQLQQQPTQAYVVSGEVTTAQALDRNRVQNATL